MFSEEDLIDMQLAGQRRCKVCHCYDSHHRKLQPVEGSWYCSQHAEERLRAIEQEKLRQKDEQRALKGLGY